MKNMVLLIDANVLLDYFMNLEPNLAAAIKLMEFCQKGIVSGYVAFHTMSIVSYMLRKWSAEDRRAALRLVAQTFTVVGATHDEVVKAVENEDFSDFEDCLQERCALAANADYIVTGNAKHFQASAVPAVTVTGILQIIIDTRIILK